MLAWQSSDHARGNRWPVHKDSRWILAGVGRLILQGALAPTISMARPSARHAEPVGRGVIRPASVASGWVFDVGGGGRRWWWLGNRA
jgi:hypothetical protein